MTETIPPADPRPVRLPVDHVLAGFFVLMLALAIVDAGKLPHPVGTIASLAGALAVVLALPLGIRRLPDGAHWIVRVVFGLAIVPVAFEAVGRMVPFIAPDSRESWLMRADRFLFSRDMTRLAGDVERFPLLTELMQLIYTSFYFLAAVLSVRLLRKHAYRAIEHAMLVIVIGFLLSYLGYFLVPVRSPYHLYSYPFELKGLWLTEPIRVLIDHLENVKYDCFPSGHSEIAMLIAALAYRYDRASFRWFFGPIGVLLPISTIYLRYHFAVDVIAAVGFAWFSWILAARLDLAAGRDAPVANPAVSRLHARTGGANASAGQ